MSPLQEAQFQKQEQPCHRQQLRCRSGMNRASVFCQQWEGREGNEARRTRFNLWCEITETNRIVLVYMAQGNYSYCPGPDADATQKVWLVLVMIYYCFHCFGEYNC